MGGEKALEAWGFVRKVLSDLTEQITQDARDERELLEGLRVLNRVTACAPNCPSTPTLITRTSSTCARRPGSSADRTRTAPTPLAMISGDRAYRSPELAARRPISGCRCWPAPA